MSDYEAIGGAEAVKLAVDRFYQRVFADDQLAPYFVGIDERRLKQHQAMLVAQVLGGPRQYDGRTLDQAHAGLNITDAHFDKVVVHFAAVLEELGVDAAIIGRAGAALRETRGQIVAPGTATSGSA